MRRIHYISGVTIAVFIILHLFNHLCSLFGAESHIEIMNSLRVVYRNVVVETILLLAVLTQILSGIRLFLKKRKTVTGFFQKVQVGSGLYLAVFFLIHVSAVLVGRLILELDTNFYFGVAGLNTFPINLFFIPYYGLAMFSFFGHISAVHSQKMKKKLLGIEPEKQSYIILFVGVILALVILGGLTNGFNGVAIPKEYDVLIGK